MVLFYFIFVTHGCTGRILVAMKGMVLGVGRVGGWWHIVGLVQKKKASKFGHISATSTLLSFVLSS